MFVQPGFFIGWNDFAQIKWTSQTILYFCKPCSVSPSFSHSIFSVLFLFFFFHSPPFIWNAGKSLWKHDITWHLTVLPQCRMVFLTICIQDGVDKVWGLSESDLGWGMGCFSLLSCFIDSSVPQCDLLTHGVLWRMVTSSLLLSWLKKLSQRTLCSPPPLHSTAPRSGPRCWTHSSVCTQTLSSSIHCAPHSFIPALKCCSFIEMEGLDRLSSFRKGGANVCNSPVGRSYMTESWFMLTFKCSYLLSM